jgi:hypothetical protein
MWLRSTVFLLIFATSGLYRANTQGAPCLVTLKISVPQTTLRVGDEIRVHIEAKDSSDKDVPWEMNVADSHAELDYQLKVFDNGGRGLVDTAYGRAVRTGVNGSVIKFALKPGQAFGEDVLLGSLYDLSHTGAYSVQAEKTLSIGADGRQWTVKSKRLKFFIAR